MFLMVSIKHSIVKMTSFSPRSRCQAYGTFFCTVFIFAQMNSTVSRFMELIKANNVLMIEDQLGVEAGADCATTKLL